MRRKNTILTVAAVLGVAATGFLLLQLFGSGVAGTKRGSQYAAEDERRRDARPGAPSARSPAERVAEPGVIAPGAAKPGLHRQPWDSAATIREREAKSGRVLQILDEMMRVDDVGRRLALGRELNELLRDLGHRVSPAVRDQLLELLTTVDPRWRNQIGEALGSLQGDEETANKLFEMLKAQPEHLRTRYAIHVALSKINVPEVAPKLLTLLGEGHPDEHLIVRTIGQAGGPAEARALLERLTSGQPMLDKTQREIVNVLRNKRDVAGLMDDVAASLRKETHPRARGSLVTILAMSKDPDHGRVLRDLARTETDPRTRKQVILGLGRLGDPESGKVLLDIVESGNEQERMRAIQAIHTIRDPKTIDRLAGSYEGMDMKGRLAIIGAAARLPQPSEDLMKLARDRGVHDSEMRIRTQAARLLGRSGRDDNVEALGGLLARAEHPGEWNTAFRALQKIGTRRAAEEGLRNLNTIRNEKQRGYWREKFEKLAARARVRARPPEDR